MYWQRLGNLPYKLALQKVCGGNATALESLCGAEIIRIIDEHICIDFLNEQLAEFENTSKVNSENARSGWEKRKKNATVKRPHSDRNAIREEKRREENTQNVDIFSNAFDNLYIDGQRMKWSHIDFDFEYDTFCNKVRGSPDRYKGHDVDGLRLAFQAQLRSAKSKPKPAKIEQNPYEIAELNKSLWTQQAWENEYKWQLKRDPEFRKHFGYDELRIGKTMGGNGER